MSSERQFYLSPRNLTGWQTAQHDRVGMKLLGPARFIRTASVPCTWAVPVWLPNTKWGTKAAHGYAVCLWNEQRVDDRRAAIPTSQMGNKRWTDLLKVSQEILEEMRRAKSSPVSPQCCSFFLLQFYTLTFIFSFKNPTSSVPDLAHICSSE